MKVYQKIYSALLIFMLSLLLLNCSSSDDNDSTDETTNNNNSYYMKVKINGTLHTFTGQYSYYGIMSNNTVAIWGANDLGTSPKIFLQLLEPSLTVKKYSLYYVNTEANAIYYTDFLTGYPSAASQNGYFVEITNYDSVNKVLTGKFSFNANVAGQMYNFTEGEFKLKYKQL